MVAPITAPATTPAPIAIGVRSRCGGRGGGGRGVVVVGAARKAGATVGVAYCALLGGGGGGGEGRRKVGRRFWCPVGWRGRSRRARDGARCRRASGGSRRPGRG